MTAISLDFAGVPDDTSGTWADGPTVVRIVEATLTNPTDSSKSKSIKLKVVPDNPNDTRYINTWVTLSPKEYPRILLKKFLSAVFQVPIEGTVDINLEDLVGHTVIAVIGTDKGVEYQKKDENGNPIGVPTRRDFNKVEGWLPYVF